MKVALLTYHFADNYGATLQAYATYKIIEDLGHEVQIIDLRIEEPEPFYKKIILLKKHFQFNSFRKKYLTKSTRRYLSVDDLKKNPPEADVFLAGSDQVWNPAISKSMASAFFLDFGSTSVKRIAYASSFGKHQWEVSEYIQTDRVKLLLEQFDHLGVRENSAVDICKNVFSVDATQVIDPVLLHRNYHEITGDIETDSGELVLYKIVNDPVFYEKARLIGSQTNLTVRSLGSIRRLKKINCNYPETIPEWIRGIAAASMVLTDSFHGTVLCLLFKKQFAVIVGNPKLVTRLKSLLSLVGLENRLFSREDETKTIITTLETKINYDKVSIVLDDLRNDSIGFLKNSLQ